MRWSALRKMFWLLISAGTQRGRVRIGAATFPVRSRSEVRLPPRAGGPAGRAEQAARGPFAVGARTSVEQPLAVDVVEGEARLHEPLGGG